MDPFAGHENATSPRLVVCRGHVVMCWSIGQWSTNRELEWKLPPTCSGGIEWSCLLLAFHILESKPCIALPNWNKTPCLGFAGSLCSLSMYVACLLQVPVHTASNRRRMQLHIELQAALLNSFIQLHHKNITLKELEHYLTTSKLASSSHQRTCSNGPVRAMPRDRAAARWRADHRALSALSAGSENKFNRSA